MNDQQPSRVRLVAFLAALAAMVYATSCAPDDGARILGPDESILTQPESSHDPFYFYDGNRIPLVEDWERVVVGDLKIPEPELASIAAAKGLAIEQIQTRLVGLDRHRILKLGAGASTRATRALVEQIRETRQAGFVSMAYRLEDGGPFVPLNRLVVHFEDGVTSSQVDSLAEALEVAILRVPDSRLGQEEYWFSYPSAPTQDPLDFAADLHENPLVDWTDPDRLDNTQRFLVPYDPYYGYQYYLKNTIYYNGVRVDDNVEAAWNLTRGNSSIRVTVVDDGVDSRHKPADLLYTGHAYDNWPCGPGCVDWVARPLDGDNHGTHVGGLIAARHNSIGMAGIAPYVRLQAARIFRGIEVASAAQIGETIDWAWSAGESDVINNSWGGGDPSNAITNAIRRAVGSGRDGKGTIVVFSAGNTGFGGVQYPAILPEVIAVGAITRNGPRANYSAVGPELDIVAPSAPETGGCGIGDVLSFDLVLHYGCNDGPQGDEFYTTTFSGTSAAAPQVAAVAALLLSREPNLTEQQVRSRILNAADYWGYANYFGAGKLNAYNTLVVATPLSAFIEGPTVVSPIANCIWYAQVSGGTPPYTYQWSGVLTGTYSYVEGSVWSSGWLYLTARDASTPQQTKNAQKFITVDWEQGPACE